MLYSTLRQTLPLKPYPWWLENILHDHPLMSATLNSTTNENPTMSPNHWSHTILIINRNTKSLADCRSWQPHIWSHHETPTKSLSDKGYPYLSINTEETTIQYRKRTTDQSMKNNNNSFSPQVNAKNQVVVLYHIWTNSTNNLLNQWK